MVKREVAKWLTKRRVFCTLASVLASSSALSSPQASLELSRTSGVAPLAVFVDATGSSHSDSSLDTFRQLGYRFEFGDANSGRWAYSNASKNVQIGGPLAAHVYETPGVYQITLTVIDRNGRTSRVTRSVEVQSADAVYAGTNTVCLSRNSDFAGCPSGAERISNTSSWPGFRSGRRYLLRSGQDFTSLGAISLGQVQDVQIGRFGSGAKPVVGRVNLQVGPPASANWIARVTVMDLDAGFIQHENVGADLLILRNSMRRPGGGIIFSGALGHYLRHSSMTGWIDPKNIFIVENEIDAHNEARESILGIAGHARNLAIMGNHIDRTHEHNVRLWQLYKGFIAHNRVPGNSSESIRHTFKIQSGGLNMPAENLQHGQAMPGFITRDVVFADNILGSSTNRQNWLVAFGPENETSPQGVERVIFERNRFHYGHNYFLDIHLTGRLMTLRGNRNDTDNRAARVGTGRQGALPGSWVGPNFLDDALVDSWFDGDIAPPGSPQLSVN